MTAPNANQPDPCLRARSEKLSSQCTTSRIPLPTIEMALRLSSGTSQSTAAALLHSFEFDVNVSTPVKADVVKFLGVIVTNLLQHGDEEKYRQLKLSNGKIQRLTAHTAVFSFLKDVLGFESVVDDGEALLKIPLSRLPSESTLQTVQNNVAGARKRIECLLPSPIVTETDQTAPLTERQKVRQRAQEAADLEKREVANARKRTVALIQADQHVRANDPNWKPSVSAAAAKSGDAMTTFRDKFGEN
jgi:PUB domain